jgi:D-xylose 1-dehydrogenase (NADP+, D-xylono-1,5-lactone-forming)
MTLAGDNPPRLLEGLRWGILGASRIAGRRFIPAVRAAGGTVAAIAASNPERAEAFAREHGITRSFGSYMALIESDDVDAVYVSLASALHYEWTLAVGTAGKPCLCEKPLVLHSRQAAELGDAFSASGARLMEAFMWRHHPQVSLASDLLIAGDIGELQRVNTQFSFRLDREEDYRWSAALGGGVLYDLAAYGVNAARLFFGAEPAHVSARADFAPGPDAVDQSVAAWLDFGQGRLATFNGSYVSGFVQGLELVGSKARLWLGRPWNNVDRPTHVVLDDGMKRTKHAVDPADPYALMVAHFTLAVLDPSLDLAPAETGIAQVRAMEALAASARDHGAPHPVTV